MHAKPKKSLGQNFLIDKNIQRKIIHACSFKESDVVLEIGSGEGALTRLISESAGMVYALEIDPDLCAALKEDFKKYKNIRIINEDILKFDLEGGIKELNDKIKVIGNIPYYITTPIIEHLIKYRRIIKTIFLTVQKEFARRVVANSGSADYGSFSCFIQYYTKPEILFSIKRTCFRPVPKVDSSFLRLDMRDTPFVIVKDEDLFFKIIRAGFNKRRKTLRNSLKGIIAPTKLDAFFRKYSIGCDVRPEELSLRDFANLANI